MLCNRTPTSRNYNLRVTPHSENPRAASGLCLLKCELNSLENLVILHQAISHYHPVCMTYAPSCLNLTNQVLITYPSSRLLF